MIQISLNFKFTCTHVQLYNVPKDNLFKSKIHVAVKCYYGEQLVVQCTLILLILVNVFLSKSNAIIVQVRLESHLKHRLAVMFASNEIKKHPAISVDFLASCLQECRQSIMQIWILKLP